MKLSKRSDKILFIAIGDVIGVDKFVRCGYS